MFCNYVALIFLCQMLLEFPQSLRESGAYYVIFPSSADARNLLRNVKIFRTWSNPAPFLITANQNSLSLSRVLMLSVTDQWAMGHSRFIIAIESSKILADPPPPHLSVYSHLHVLRHFYFCTFIFDVPSFCCLAYQFLAHVVFA